MTDSFGFAAELLRRSAAGYAGNAATVLLERETDLREQGGAQAAWRAHLTQRLFELAAALAAGEAKLFSERVSWSRKTFLARGQDERLLAVSLNCLREVLADHLPANAGEPATNYLDQALERLSEDNSGFDESELDPADEKGRLALNYLQDILEGDSSAATASIIDAVTNGLSVQSAYIDVLLGAQKEIGRLWHSSEATVAEEHLVSATTQRTMAILAHTSKRAAYTGKTIVIACAAGNAHDIAARALSDLYHLNGWRSIFLGADVPAHDLPGTLDAYEADVFALSGTLSTHIEQALNAVRLVREQAERPVKIMIGGAAFDEVPELAVENGADIYMATLEEAVEYGRRLVDQS